MIKDYRKSWLKTPKGLHYAQKCRAKQRGIGFFLTFDEWLEVWGYCLPYRGRNAGNLCMCRYGDKGNYEVGNVYIDTMENNVKIADGRKKRTNAKLTEEDIPEIRNLIEDGVSSKLIGEMFCISRQSVNDIKSGRSWRLV